MDVAEVELSAEQYTDEATYWVNPQDYMAAVRANRFCEFRVVRRFHPESMPLRLLKMHGLVITRGNMQLEGDLLNFIPGIMQSLFDSLGQKKLCVFLLGTLQQAY